MLSECRECGESLSFANLFECRDCHANLCARHSYQRVDGNNASITRHSPTLCLQCYQERYPEEASR